MLLKVKFSLKIFHHQPLEIIKYSKHCIACLGAMCRDAHPKWVLGMIPLVASDHCKGMSFLASVFLSFTSLVSQALTPVPSVLVPRLASYRKF